jgi:hypothetical protein
LSKKTFSRDAEFVWRPGGYCHSDRTYGGVTASPTAKMDR